MFRQKSDRIIQSKSYRKMHTITNEDLTSEISGALRREAGHTPSAVKFVASRIRRNARAARNWLEGHNAPRAAELIELMREFDEVHEAVLRLANRNPASSDESVQLRIQRAMKILSGESNEEHINRVSSLGGNIRLGD